MFIPETKSANCVDSQCQQVFEEVSAARLEDRRRHIREMKARASRSAHSHPTSGHKRRTARPELPSLDHHYIQELEHLCLGHEHPTGGVQLHLDRALAHLAYAHGLYERAQYIIGQMVAFVPPALECELETIWDHSSYHIYGANLMLNSVNKYRIRKRAVCPTVLKSGGKKYKLSREATRQLSRQFAINPKPDRSVREQLSNLLGLSMSTVSNWFKNRRQRVRCDLISSLCSTSQTTGSPVSTCPSTQASDCSSASPSSSLVSTSPTSSHSYIHQEHHPQPDQQQHQHQVCYYVQPEELAQQQQIKQEEVLCIYPHEQEPQMPASQVIFKTEQGMEEMEKLEYWLPTVFCPPDSDIQLLDDLVYEMIDPTLTLDFP